MDPYAPDNEPEPEPEPEPERPGSDEAPSGPPTGYGPPPVPEPVFGGGSERSVRGDADAAGPPRGALFGTTRVRSDERAFRIVELSVHSDGRVHARVLRELTTKVYNRPVSLRMVKYEAQQIAKGETVLVLLRPTGSVAGVWAAGSGRKAPAGVARRAKRMVRELLPHLFPARTRRTSRRKTAVRAKLRTKRTSRRPAKRAARGR